MAEGGMKILICPALVTQYANLCPIGSKQLLVPCSTHTQKYSPVKCKAVSVLY